MKLKFHYGFSLVEILIVVAIIAILAGLAVPRFKKTIEQAKNKEAFTNLRLILAGQRAYRNITSQYNQQGFFYPYPNPTAAENSLNNINSNLRIDLSHFW